MENNLETSFKISQTTYQYLSLPIHLFNLGLWPIKGQFHFIFTLLVLEQVLVSTQDSLLLSTKIFEVSVKLV